MAYKIGSFNLYKLSYISGKDIKKNFEKIAEIIDKEDFDIIALQEVFSESSIKELIRWLGGPNVWEYRWEIPISKTVQSAEGYAFLWKKKSHKIELNDSKENGMPRKNPKILNGYSYNHTRSMIRPPYYASFYTKDGFAELRLINTHIFYGDNSAVSKQIRQEEFKLMANNMYERLSQSPDGSNRAIYTIILGDYNLNLRRQGFIAPHVEDETKISYKGEQEILLTVQDQLTSLKRPKDEDYKEGYNGYSQNYDHCSYGKLRFDGVVITAERISAVEEYYNGDFAGYRREVSDHVPIMINLELNPYRSNK